MSGRWRWCRRYKQADGADNADSMGGDTENLFFEKPSRRDGFWNRDEGCFAGKNTALIQN